MDTIKGALCWIAFIEAPGEEKVIRVRLRSRFVTINEIAEKYHGGGHANASGATVYSIEEMNALLADADQHVKQYKETHNAYFDALDELKIVQLLGHNIDVYDNAIIGLK